MWALAFLRFLYRKIGEKAIYLLHLITFLAKGYVFCEKMAIFVAYINKV